jgi:hypothetical protein
VILLFHGKHSEDIKIRKSLHGISFAISGHDHLLFDPPRNSAGAGIYQAFERRKIYGQD